MDYQLENLGPEIFQEFCQALLLCEFPNLQCLPVAQPDGGRDAFHRAITEVPDDFSVFQVKFVRNPASIKDPHKWLVETLEAEAPKIEKLIPKGASQYFFLTNVRGTAHLESGSIDKLAEILRRNISIPSTCWWRDDINRRLDSAYNLKWSYPNLLSGTDVLRELLENRLGEDKERRTRTIKAFLKGQYDFDEKVRFKQVELQSDLLDLFVDVPIDKHPSRNNLKHNLN